MDCEVIDWINKVSQIIGLCMELNLYSSVNMPEVSFEFNGHTRSFEVRVFPNGWNKSVSVHGANRWFIATENNIEMFDKIIEYITELLSKAKEWGEEVTAIEH